MFFDELYILGSGGHGKVVAEIALKSERFKKIYFLDDNYEKRKYVYSIEVKGDLSEISLNKIVKSKSAAITAFGDGYLRSKYHLILKKLKIPIISLVHKSSQVSTFSRISLGTSICAGTIIGPNAEIGEGVIINHNSSVDHDCKIKDFVHICPGVNLAGSVTVDQFTQVGIGSSVIQGIKIGHNCQVGAGSVVIKNVKDKSKVVGAPAKDMVNFC